MTRITHLKKSWLVQNTTGYHPGLIQYTTGYHPGPEAPPTTDKASFKPTISWLKGVCSTIVQVQQPSTWKIAEQLRIFSQLFWLAAGSKVTASSVQVSAQLRSVPLLYFTTTTSMNHNNWPSNGLIRVTAQSISKPEEIILRNYDPKSNCCDTQS